MKVYVVVVGFFFPSFSHNKDEKTRKPLSAVLKKSKPFIIHCFSFMNEQKSKTIKV